MAAAVLIPPPRIHVVRFHGVFAPNCKLRRLVVPQRPTPHAPANNNDKTVPMLQLPLIRADATYRLEWASLIQRFFAADVLACGRCHGRMRVLAVIEEPAVVDKILGHLGLPAVPIPIAAARQPPQPAFDFGAA